jgi:hypothetical protein
MILAEYDVFEHFRESLFWRLDDFDCPDNSML